MHTPLPPPRVAERRKRFSVETIERLVHEFYAKVQADAVLGPVFERRIDAWPEHLDRMVSFWRAVLRAEPTFTPAPRGNPLELHRGIEELEQAHFERWLELFGHVADDLFPRTDALHVKLAAKRIGESLSKHLQPIGERPR